MLVSIIISTRNEENNMNACLESIRKQTYPQKNIEIIVIDNNSTDKTKAIAEKYTDNVFDYGPERSAQRNYGVSKCHGSYILYLDADMTLHPEVISACVNKIQSKSKIIALYIPEIIRGYGFWGKARNFERSFYTATPIDAVRFIRKENFTEIGGFDHNLISHEDWDLTKRLRAYGQLDKISIPLYHNELSQSFIAYIKKKARYMTTVDNYLKKYPFSDKDIQKQYGIWYRYFGVFTENGKWKKIIKHPLLFLYVLVGRFMVGMVFIINKITRS